MRSTQPIICRFVFTLTVCCASISVSAQTWIYDETEGGWKDTQTGLVWYDPFTAGRLDEARAWAADLVWLGCDDWRLPTVAEMQTAADHAINDNVPLVRGDVDPPPTLLLWWSSKTTGKRKAYAVDLRNGTKQRVLLPTSWLHFIYVRQGTVD